MTERKVRDILFNVMRDLFEQVYSLMKFLCTDSFLNRSKGLHF